MGKEYFESLERLAMPDELHIKECKKLGIGLTEDYDVVEQALLRLDALDSANPSEALELAELLECDLQATNDLVTRTINGYDYLDILDTIKQALLKAQEPKQYLKWEDLEFKEEEQTMLVKIGDNQYKIWYRQFKNGKQTVQTVQIANYYPFRSLANLYGKDIDKQFFNDLHLEVIKDE